MNWKEAPDPNWVPVIREGTVALTILVIALLAGLVAIGHVEKDTSYGLIEIIGVLSTLAGVLMGKK